MKTVNLDRFLQFWSHHNQTIIQVLIVLTLLFIVALVFMTLFGAKEAEPEIIGGVSLSPELESSLKRALEVQTNAKAAVYDFSKGDAAAPKLQEVADSESSGASSEKLGRISKDLERAKSEIVEREKAIQDLKTQLIQVSNQAQQSAASTGTAQLEARIKELEARLAEYDIISEDIADLSRYKEENEKLKAQIQAQGGAVAEAPATEAEIPSMPDAQTAAEPASLDPAAVKVPEPGASQDVPVAPVSDKPSTSSNLHVVPDEIPPEGNPGSAEEISSNAAQEDEVSEATNATIDDDLMKEFAAAVEGQKASMSQEAVQQTAENEDLMGQFEDFVQKKDKP